MDPPKEWDKSPFWVKELWSIDSKKGMIGIRLFNTMTVVLPGRRPFLSIPSLTNSSPICMTTPHCPPPNVIELFQRMNSYEHFEGTNKYTGRIEGTSYDPWLRFSDYQTLYSYLKSVMPIDGDESVWSFVIRGLAPESVTDILRLASLFQTGYVFAQNYAVICGRFGHHGNNLVSIPDRLWEMQPHMREVTSLDDFIHIIEELIPNLFPAPHYPIPSANLFSSLIDGYHMKPPRPSLSWRDIIVMQPNIGLIAHTYVHQYPEYALASSTIIRNNQGLLFKQPSVEERLSLPMVENLKNFLGDKDFDANNYTLLEEKWGIHQSPKIESVSITLSPERHIECVYLNAPTVNMLEDMIAFDKLFSGKQAFLSLDWVGRIDSFFRNLQVLPMEPYDVNTMKKQLMDIESTTIACIWMNRLCSVYSSYVQFTKKKTLNWTKREEAKWNEYGLTKKEEQNVILKQAPFSDDNAKALWPDLTILTRNEFYEYLAYMLQTRTSMLGDRVLLHPPRLKEKELFKDQATYDQACTESIRLFSLWCETMWTHRDSLSTYPICTHVVSDEKDEDGKNIVVFNWYPDLGYWDDNATTGQKIAQFFYSPIKTLTGKTFWQHEVEFFNELLRLATVAFGILLNCLKKFLKVATDAGWQGMVPFAVIGGVIILGIRELGKSGLIK